MTNQRLVTKQLAGEQDLLLLEGTVDQQRAGGTYPITGIRTIRPCNSLAELEALDPLKFPKASLHNGQTVTFYEYNAGKYEAVSVGDTTPLTFGTVDAMKAETGLTAGDYVQTVDYYSTQRGGGASYLVKTTAQASADGDIIDGYGNHAMINGNVAVLQASGKLNVLQFGAKSDSSQSVTANFQAALDRNTGSIYAPIGDYLFDSPIIPRLNFSGISGDRGTNFISTGGATIIRIASKFSAENVACSNIGFTTDVNGTGTAIDNSQIDYYISHWHFIDCDFSSFLDYGVNGNLIGCLFDFCKFGFHQSATRGLNFKAINSIGQAAPIATTNINKFNCCEFAKIKDVDYPINFQYGSKVLFESCIFEQITNVISVVNLSGIYYPTFRECWFEANQAQSEIRTEEFGGIDQIVLRIEGCLFDEGGVATVSKAIIDTSNTFNRGLVITNTLFARGSAELYTNNSLDEPNFIEWNGNYSTNTAIAAPADTPAKFSQGIELDKLQTGEVIIDGDNAFKMSKTWILQTTSKTKTTDIAIPYINQQAGGLVVVRGTAGNGVSYSALYNLALKFAAGADTNSVLINEVGPSVPVTFTNNGGFLQISIPEGFGAITFLGF